jgi:hypothetical protein
MVANATGARVVNLYKNGTGGTLLATNVSSPGSSLGAATVSVEEVITVVAGDTLGAYAFQNSGVALNANATIILIQIA